jgi:hypothetical protein
MTIIFQRNDLMHVFSSSSYFSRIISKHVHANIQLVPVSSAMMQNHDSISPSVHLLGNDGVAKLSDWKLHRLTGHTGAVLSARLARLQSGYPGAWEPGFPGASLTCPVGSTIERCLFQKVSCCRKRLLRAIRTRWDIWKLAATVVLPMMLVRLLERIFRVASQPRLEILIALWLRLVLVKPHGAAI